MPEPRGQSAIPFTRDLGDHRLVEAVHRPEREVEWLDRCGLALSVMPNRDVQEVRRRRLDPVQVRERSLQGRGRRLHGLGRDDHPDVDRRLLVLRQRRVEALERLLAREEVGPGLVER